MKQAKTHCWFCEANERNIDNCIERKKCQAYCDYYAKQSCKIKDPVLGKLPKISTKKVVKNRKPSSSYNINNLYGFLSL